MKCVKCGQVFEENAEFCMQCGCKKKVYGKILLLSGGLIGIVTTLVLTIGLFIALFSLASAENTSAFDIIYLILLQLFSVGFFLSYMRVLRNRVNCEKANAIMWENIILIVLSYFAFQVINLASILCVIGAFRLQKISDNKMVDEAAFFKKIGVVVSVMIIALIIKSYTNQLFKIPSSAMEETLLIGDLLIANKMKYGFTDPKKGDVVTFKSPENEKINLVSRVIGMPGETIEIINKQVYLNGELYRSGKEIYRDQRIFRREANQCVWDGEIKGSRDNFGPVDIPEGHYFVMGDNRDMSYDSRFFGFVNRKDITGKPAMILLSFSEPDNQTRWDRSFKVIR